MMPDGELARDIAARQGMVVIIRKKDLNDPVVIHDKSGADWIVKPWPDGSITILGVEKFMLDGKSQPRLWFGDSALIEIEFEFRNPNQLVSLKEEI
jgi:hypothetical protein